ncbi:hypothetical protein NEF87_004886 [Candidatus Lokiarchaeum ossiferum]|uniref:Novel STAND NTPase 3 domain-containing protein n=1 Tax=Candidatus Lokiarchaeum ossiferum TaxID=2951803 RepID=A0ABY6I1A4_9ARCH|nr:hypothetical protein NEF87_004886 [Candidatus Lokiarchaeum sp. B-35]
MATIMNRKKNNKIISSLIAITAIIIRIMTDYLINIISNNNEWISTLLGIIKFVFPTLCFLWVFLRIYGDYCGKRQEFLEIIGYSGTKWYQFIDKCYVKPNEYKSMKHILKTEKILFIIGPPQYGKTYTAVKFLKEFYIKKKLNPIWIKGDSVQNRRVSRQFLLELETKNVQDSIIYIEDPFGKTKYERRVGIERNLLE